MATLYEKINKKFLSKVTDDLYVTLTEEDAKEDMLNIMESALALFKYPKVDVDDRDDDTEEFTDDLNTKEINIIAECMKFEWIQRQINDLRVIRISYTDKDFKSTSQAYHLAKLIDLVTYQENRIKILQDEYSMVDRTNGGASFAGLAGDGRR